MTDLASGGRTVDLLRPDRQRKLDSPAGPRSSTFGPSICSSGSWPTSSTISASATATTCSASPGAGCLPRSTHSPSRPGCSSIVLSDTAASFGGFAVEANKLRAGSSADVEATLQRHEDAGTTDDPEYLEACLVFYSRHLCRVDPWPEEMWRTFNALSDDPTVYGTTNGPSEFHVIGTFKDWSVIDRLGEIRIPTLVISGRHDEATPALQEGAPRRYRRVRAGHARGVVPHALPGRSGSSI